MDEQMLISVGAWTIVALLGVCAFFVVRLINSIDRIKDDHIKFFGRNGEKDLLWQRVDVHERDIKYLEHHLQQTTGIKLEKRAVKPRFDRCEDTSEDDI
jgi:hypothetical protein